MNHGAGASGGGGGGGDSVAPTIVDSTAIGKDEGGSAVNVFVHRDESSGAWVITPLSDAAPVRLAKVAKRGRPPVTREGVVWRLDSRIFENTGGSGQAGVLATSVPRRMKRLGARMKEMRAATSILQAKLSKHQEDVLELEAGRKRLTEAEQDLTRRQSEIEVKTVKIKHEFKRFDEEVVEAAGQLARAMNNPIKAGGHATVPADIFFLAARDEFARTAPNPTDVDLSELQNVRLSAEAALVSAKEDFFGRGDNGGSADATAKKTVDLQTRINAVVRALLVAHCWRKKGFEERRKQALDQLCGMAQMLSRFANSAGRWPLAFAASATAVWCASHLTLDHRQRWTDEEISTLITDMEAQQQTRNVLDRVRQLGNYCSGSRRILRIWSDYFDHRRRFVYFMSTHVSETSDLRLLFLTRNAEAKELVGHIRRLEGFVDASATVSQRKRPRLHAPAAAHVQVSPTGSAPAVLPPSPVAPSTASSPPGHPTPR